MENENKPDMTPMQVLLALGCAAVIGILVLINAHWHTIVRWIETVFWVAVAGVVLFVLASLLGRGNLIYNPFDRYGRFMRQMDKEIKRVKGGQDDTELSEYKRELIHKIQNHYQDKIDKLYD